MDPVGLVVGLGMGIGMAVGINIGIAVGRQKRPLKPEEVRKQRKLVTIGVGLLVLGVIAFLANWVHWFARGNCRPDSGTNAGGLFRTL